MVSDQEIANCVESILRQCPPDPTLTTSTSSTSSTPTINVTGVVQQLQAKLGLDLSHKAGFIRDHISLLLRLPPKDHFSLQQQQQQQQQQFLQQQYLGGGYMQHQMMQQQHQIQQSPFTHLPHQHELTFRCAPPAQMQRQQQQAAVAAAAASAAATSVMQKHEGNAMAFAPGSSGPVAPAKGSGQSGKRRGGPGGLNKVCGVSPELEVIVGEPTMARTQIVKQLWAYIRKNNLQDPNNKRKIICNDELRLVFETDCTDMFKMNKLLAKHIIPLGPTKEPGHDTKKIKTAEAVPSSEPVTANQPVTLSDALVEFFGTGETQMLQSEALKRIWDYIKVNQLEDPLNSMVIQFDAKLQQLFGCESLSAIGVSEMLSRHLFKQS